MDSAGFQAEPTASGVAREDAIMKRPLLNTSGAATLAGATARALAFRWRMRSLLVAGSAGILLAIACLSDLILRDLSTLVRRSLALPLWIYGICLGCGVVASIVAALLWKKADQVDREAETEEAVDKALRPLRQEGWRIRYGLPIGSSSCSRIALISPQQQPYMLEVLAYRGRVGLQEGTLLRLIGSRPQPFDHDWLQQARQGAISLQDYTGERFVIPVLVFVNGHVTISRNPVDQVYIVDRKTLVTCLRLLG